MDSYMIGLLVGAVLVGSIVGMIPVIYGFEKEKKGLAIGGFFACVVSHFILGLVLSVPVCIVFMLLISRKDKNKNINSTSSIEA